MILISVGASEYSFDRLLKIIDELCEEKKINGKNVVAQIGLTKYKPKNYKSFELISREEYQEYVDKADFIITHAGTGCVVPPLNQGKKLIIFPRLEEYGEHIDNHQLDLCKVFEENGYALCAKNKKELLKCINSIGEFMPEKFKSNKNKFNNKLIEYIEKIG